MTMLVRIFKKKITTIGGKGEEHKKAKEGIKRRNEESQRLEKEAAEWLQKGEEEKSKAAQEATEKAA